METVQGVILVYSYNKYVCVSSCTRFLLRMLFTPPNLVMKANKFVNNCIKINLLGLYLTNTNHESWSRQYILSIYYSINYCLQQNVSSLYQGSNVFDIQWNTRQWLDYGLMGQLPVEQTVLSVVMLYQFVNAGYLKLNRDSNAVLENPHLDGLLNVC